MNETAHRGWRDLGKSVLSYNYSPLTVLEMFAEIHNVFYYKTCG